MRGGPLHDRTVQLWRVIAAAGAKGIAPAELRDRFEGVYDEEPIKCSLQGLVRGGYAVTEGTTRWARWKVTAECKTPAGEATPAWLLDVGGTDDDAQAPSPAEVALPSAPASVFNLGAQVPDERVQVLSPDMPDPEARHRGGHALAAARRFDRATSAPHAALDWKAPAAADRVSGWDDDDHAAAAAAAAADETLVGGAGPAAFSQPPAPRDTSHRDAEFCCYVDSDGDMFIRSGDEQIELPLKHTRKLLNYLDGLRADELVVAQAEGAAS